MDQDKLNRIKELKDSKSEDDRKICIPLLQEFLKENPNDAVAWYDLAGCFDFCGLESQAEPCYEKTFELGWKNLPLEEQPGFFVGYGSTLRNNFKFSASERILQEAIVHFPKYPALKCFLAFSFYSAGKYQDAAKVLFQSTLEMPEKSFDGYDRAIKWYVQNLETNPEMPKL
jgi:tetratricopeptide (TPR) repeat protein